MVEPLPAYEGTEPYVFVSYSHEDRDEVFGEIRWLQDEAFNVWYDTGISGGSEWSEAIAKAIKGASRFIYFITPRSVDSENCRRELNFALEEEVSILAVHLEETVVPDGLRLNLNNRQALFRHNDPAYRVNLAAALGHTDRPATPTQAVRSRTSNRGPLALAALAIATVIILIAAYGLYQAQTAPVSTMQESPQAAEPTQVPAARKSIAVLPFVNMSSDPEQEYFSDGISEELLNLLAKNPKLRVISRSSAFTFKGKDVDIPTVAERLGVAHVLEGSVRKSGNTIRVTAQLIDAETDTQLWSETYDRKLDDVFAIQDEIASHVVAQLNVTLFGMPAAKREINLDAYTLYLQGRHLASTETAENLGSAEAMLKEALALDPNYVEAWIELSRVYFLMRQASAMPGEEALRLYRQALQRARAIDPENADIYAMLAFDAMTERRDLSSAARYLERGMELEPTNLLVTEAASVLSLNLGRLEEAEAFTAYIAAHDPLCDNCFSFLGNAYLLQGKLDDAARAYKTHELVGGGSATGNLTFALTLLLQGKYEASMAAWAQSNPGPFRAYGEAVTLFSMGRNEEFSAKFLDLKDRFGADYPTLVARVYAWMGNRDAAFEWLGRYTVEQPELGPVFGNFWEFLSPELKSLHDDPRWQPHLERLGIAPAQLAKFEFDVPLPTQR